MSVNAQKEFVSKAKEMIKQGPENNSFSNTFVERLIYKGRRSHVTSPRRNLESLMSSTQERAQTS